MAMDTTVSSSPGSNLPPVAPARYVFDGRRSRVTVRTIATGLLSAFAHNPMVAVRELSGEARFAPDAPDTPDLPGGASLSLRMATASFSVQNDVEDKERHEMERVMHDEVLDVTSFPEITFASRRASIEKAGEGRYRVTLSGELTLHGVTRPQSVTAQVFEMNGTLRAQGDLTLRQTDFGITLVSAAGGTLKLKDELIVTFDIAASRVS